MNDPVILVRTGSQLYGTNISDTPDNDEMGIFIETPEQVFSADPTAARDLTITARTAGTLGKGLDAKSQAGDVDRQLYSLNHFIRETAKGNPNTITVLFAPRSHVMLSSPAMIFESLRNYRGRFISKAMGQRYLGYLKNQRHLYLGDKRPQRPELVAQYGFDTKGAYHALRVAIQGFELMSTGHMHLPMTAIDRAYLSRVRKGEFSKDQVLEHLNVLEDYLEREIVSSQWPTKPDYSVLTQLNYELHRLYWSYLRDQQSV